MRWLSATFTVFLMSSAAQAKVALPSAVSDVLQAIKRPELANEEVRAVVFQVLDVRNRSSEGALPSPTILNLTDISNLLEGCEHTDTSPVEPQVEYWTEWKCESGEFQGVRLNSYVRTSNGHIDGAGLQIGIVSIAPPIPRINR